MCVVLEWKTLWYCFESSLTPTGFRLKLLYWHTTARCTNSLLNINPLNKYNHLYITKNYFKPMHVYIPMVILPCSPFIALWHQFNSSALIHSTWKFRLLSVLLRTSVHQHVRCVSVKITTLSILIQKYTKLSWASQNIGTHKEHFCTINRTTNWEYTVNTRCSLKFCWKTRQHDRRDGFPLFESSKLSNSS